MEAKNSDRGVGEVHRGDNPLGHRAQRLERNAVCTSHWPFSTLGYSGFWIPPDYWDADDLTLEMTGDPIIWTDGSREEGLSSRWEVAGSGV